MLDAVRQSASAYRSAEGDPGSAHFAPYLALNRLALDAVSAGARRTPDSAAVPLAQQCRTAARQRFTESGQLWDAVMQCEALLVQRLLEGRLAGDDDEGRAAFEEIARAYEETLDNTPVRPSQLDTIVSQIEILSRFHDALAHAQRDAARRLIADRLLELVQRIRPGRAPRTDRPAPAAKRAARGRPSARTRPKPKRASKGNKA